MPEPEDDLHGLGAAFQRAAGTLRDLTRAADDNPLGVLKAMIALDDALAAATPMLAAVPAFVSAAEPGEPAETQVRDQSAAIAEMARRVAEARARLESGRADERRLAELAAEHAELTRRVEDLARGERLAEELPALREQHQVLTERAAAFADPALRLEKAVELAAQDLERITTQRVDGLRAEVTAALAAARAAQADLPAQLERLRAEATAAEQEVQSLRTEVAGLDTRAGELAAEHQHLRDRLAARLSANQRVAASLGSLRAVDRQLDEVDAALATALRAQQADLAASRERRFPGGI